jgi:chorismate mutase
MTLEDLRKLIDQLNAEIIALFSERLKVARQIAHVKKESRLPVHDPLREERQLQMLRELSQKHGLSPAVMEEIFTLFVDYSKLNMKMEMGDEKNCISGN